MTTKEQIKQVLGEMGIPHSPRERQQSGVPLSDELSSGKYHR